MSGKKVLAASLVLVAVIMLLTACTGSTTNPAGSSTNDPTIPRLTTSTGWWIDTTGQISKETLAALNSESEEINKAGFQLGGAIFIDCKSEPIDLATKFINENGIGYAGKDNGVGVVVFLDQKGSDSKKPAISIGTGRGIEGILNDAKVGRILDLYFVPARAEGKWEQGLIETVQAIHRFMGNPESEEFKVQPSWWDQQPREFKVLLIILAIVIALIILVGLASLGVLGGGDGGSGGGYFGGGGSSGLGGGGSSGGGGASR